MRVLVIKLTSMGDVIHALPALTDAKQYIPEIEFDFVVEESFQEIPTWHFHAGVKKVIPVATRRWRKNIVRSRKEILTTIKSLRNEPYDAIIDAQGLLKSALIGAFARGARHGYDKQSIREPLATKLYQCAHNIDRSAHAIDRIRMLFSQALGYEGQIEKLLGSQVNYGLRIEEIPHQSHHAIPESEMPYVVFLHGTTWLAKEWPEENWVALANKVSKTHSVYVPWGNEFERKRAERIAKESENIVVLPKLNLSTLAHVIASSQAVVAVDTGLGHLSASLSIPTISIYGPTDTKLIGARGKNQHHLLACDNPNWQLIKKNEAFDYGKVSVEIVYEQLQAVCS